MEMQTVDPARAPKAFDDEVLTVIGPDGATNPKTDPKLDSETMRDLYKAMVRTRIVDEQLVKLQRQGRIGFHIGSLGEEACIIGSAAAHGKEDWIFPCYREFGALLHRGYPLQRYLDNMYGNADDQVRGRQMPDHYTGKEFNFGSVSSPIGTQMTQAVGFGWAAQKKGEKIAVGVYFGEGASSSNEFHCAMNFAGVFKTPTVFLLRNNRWAISVPSERQSASATFAEKGKAYGVRSIQCDGNDVLATYVATREAVERAKNGEGPTLIELLTYRIGGHSTSDDPRAYRVDDEVEQWRKTDPLVRTKGYLESKGLWSDAEEASYKQSVEAELRDCISKAEAKPKPSLESMFDDVFEDRPWHLEEQCAEMVDGPRAKSAH